MQSAERKGCMQSKVPRVGLHAKIGVRTIATEVLNIITAAGHGDGESLLLKRGRFLSIHNFC